jgi:hypothetical protein
MLLSAMRRPVLWETTVLALLCLLDMFSTILVIKLGMAVEANPILAPFIRQSFLSFALVKSAFFIPPLAILESLRPVRPRFVRLGLRAGIAGYLLVYVLGSIGVHGIF